MKLSEKKEIEELSPEEAEKKAEAERKAAEKAAEAEKKAEEKAAKRQAAAEKKAKRMEKRMSGESYLETRTMRSGGYSIGLIALVLAIIIAVNVIFNTISTKYTVFDMTASYVFTLTDTTLEVLEDMDSDVTLYTIATPGTENDYMSTYVELYDAASDKIHTETKDPSIDFNFLEEYSVNVTAGSVVVVGTRWVCSECGYEVVADEKPGECESCHSEDSVFTRKHKIVDLSDVFINAEDEDTGEEYTESVDIEGQLTTAIAYVSSAYIQTVYYVEGHGEETSAAPSTEFANEVMKLNVDLDYWDMSEIEVATGTDAVTEYVPSDCDLLIINGPSEDFSDAETEAILEYLDEGGAALILIRLNTNEGFSLPNFEKILAAYGVECAGGGVVESNSNYYYSGQVYSLVPRIRSHAITEDLITDEESLIFYLADALDVLSEVEGKENLSVTPILTTSSSAYLKERGSVTTAKTDGDRTGTFNLGVAITNPTDDGGETRIVVYSSHYVMTDNANDTVDGGNYDLLVNTISWLLQQEDNISISPKSLLSTSLVLTTAQENNTGVLVAAVIPLIILAAGFIVWQSRRKR